MRARLIAMVLAAIARADVDAAAQAPVSTVFVDCSRSIEGDGASKSSPVSTISAAMSLARVMTAPVSIEVAAGVCNRETLPISLDVPMRLRGARVPTAPDDERPDGNQSEDTIVTADGLGTTFFAIRAPDVQISNLSIVGARPMGADGNRAPALAPLGVSAVGVTGYQLTHLRIQGVGQAVRSEASSGVIRNNFVAGDNPIFVSGGAAADALQVVVTNNRVVYRVNGIPAAGGGAFGTHLRLRITDNDVLTGFANTGPTSPAALRLSPVTVGSAGTFDVVAEHNYIGGPAKYGIMIHAGQPVRADGATYTGTLTARLTQNIIDPAVVRPSLVTFTNSRATVFPCELNPALAPGPDCPSLSTPPVYSEYLTAATYDLRHSGELDGEFIDHPQFHPVDRHALGNQLILNRVPASYRTFLVVPGTSPSALDFPVLGVLPPMVR